MLTAIASAILNHERRSAAVEFLLKLMRMSHMIIGITAPPPEHERYYLLVWALSLLLILVFSVGLVLLLVPKIMH
jgi:hypothetical protein